MASNEATLKTLITADNKQFIQSTLQAKKQVMDLAQAISKQYGTALNESQSIARQALSNTREQLTLTQRAAEKLSDGFMTLGKTLLAAFAVGKITEKFHGISESIDSLSRSAEKLDVPATKLQEFEFAAKLVDGTIADVEAGFKKLRTSISEASNGNKEAANGFAKLGLSFYNLSKMDVADAYSKVADAVVKLKSSNAQTSAVNDIFGKKAGQEQLLLLKKLTEARKLYQENAFGLTQGEFESFDQFDMRVKLTAASVDNQLRKAFIQLLPAVNTVANAFAGIVNGVNVWVKGIKEGVAVIGQLGSKAGTSLYDLTHNAYSANANPYVNRSADGSYIVSQRNQQNALRARSGTILGANAGSTVNSAEQLGFIGLATLTKATKMVTENLSAFTVSLAATTKGLDTFRDQGLKNLLGIKRPDEVGRDYLSSISPFAQIRDPEFDRKVNELRDNVFNGKGDDGANYSLLQDLRSIASGYSSGQQPLTDDQVLNSSRDELFALMDRAPMTNSGMINAVNQLAVQVSNNQLGKTSLGEVTVKIEVDKNGIITAFSTSTEGISLMEAAARGMISKTAQQTGF